MKILDMDSIMNQILDKITCIEKSVNIETPLLT